MRKVMWFSLSLTIVFAITVLAAQPANLNRHEVKYVIMMVPDGMGLADVTAARILKNCGNIPGTPPQFCTEGPGGPPLYLETLEHVGYERTYSKTNTITDSSAAASAFACGEKFVNNEVCFHADGTPHNPSVLELAQSKGMATGLVATQTITHATPAAFASHLNNRNCETEIARQYIEVTRPDVLLGGGQSKFNSAAPDACGTAGDFIAEAQSRGYTYVDTKDAMNSATPRTNRILGLFASKNLTPEYLGTRPVTEPRLPDMTSAALTVLERSHAGFFLMVEGSLIDSGNHEENLQYQYGEIKAFDESVKTVLDWINANQERREHTLLIILPDHETGGFALRGVGTKGGELANAGLGPFMDSWVFTLIPSDPNDFEAHHTGGDLVLWSQGPGSEALGRAIDNTFVYQVVKAMLKY
ncbi:MAG: alkaline phosphatase [Bryobacteraceae bacterium]